MTTTPGRTRRPDESMTLLTDFMARPLDPGYAAAARRRAEQAAQDGGRPDDLVGRRGRSPLAVLVLAVVGGLLSASFVQARGSRPAGVAQREQLVAQIQRTSAEADRLQRANAAALAAIEAARGRSLQAQAQGELAQQVSSLGILTGAVATTGPGIEVTVNDAASVSDAGDGSAPRDDKTADDGRVLDRDLQAVTNGLWAAGAEGMAINGQRLTALSAIRSAGEAVLVDYRPLAPPYRISAVGDPPTLRSRFIAGPGGRELRSLQSRYGIRAAITTAQQLTLPASSSVVTRRAKVLGPAPATSSSDVPSTSRQTP